MGQSPLHRNWEISAVSGARAPGGAGKAKSRNPAAHAAEKSDTSVVPEKPLNKGPGTAEIVEERDVAKGNTDRPPAPRTQSRISYESMGLEGVREAARRNEGMQFTPLLHRITPQLLAQSFYALRRDAAVGVDGMSWRDYKEGLLQRVFQQRSGCLAGLRTGRQRRSSASSGNSGISIGISHQTRRIFFRISLSAVFLAICHYSDLCSVSNITNTRRQHVCCADDDDMTERMMES